MKVIHLLPAVILVAFSVWLFTNENAAAPGQLSPAHLEVAACQDCHEPWRGVSDFMCLNCHEFYEDVSQVRPLIRFHEAERHCLKCHREHVPIQNISNMDHTLLNAELKCAQCHLDPHDSLFGEDCRTCHGIDTWQIAGFRHPPEDRGNCNRCHRAPDSHGHEEFKSMIVATHPSLEGADLDMDLKQCRRCHVIHDWRHLRMMSQR